MTTGCNPFAETLPSGMNALGRPVPDFRRAAGYEACKAMGLVEADSRFSTVNGMSEKIERDQPYEALEIAKRVFDLSGAYRLLAVLLTSEPK